MGSQLIQTCVEKTAEHREEMLEKFLEKTIAKEKSEFYM